MTYNKTNWVNGETPLNAENLNKIEKGIEDVTNLINNMEIPFKNIDIFTSNELQDETDGDYITLRLSGNLEPLKPIYIYINTSAGQFLITIVNLLGGSKSIYIVNEDGETRHMSNEDFYYSYYVGIRGENYLELNIFGALKLFGNFTIEGSNEVLSIEYEESKSCIEIEL